MDIVRERKILSHESSRPMSLGCMSCPESETCGGNQTGPGIFDCGILCQCEDTSECSNVCMRNKNYIARVQEIRGFSLNNIARTLPVIGSRIPLTVPIIYHSYKRLNPVDVQAVAIPLRSLFNHKDREIGFENKQEVAEHFKFPESAQLIISGSDDDKHIESYWSYRTIKKLPEKLAKLQPALITSPNYSMVLGVVRTDNMYNMKRIGLAWQELAAQSIHTALHVNARTDRDWERWAEFIKEREEVRAIAFEFATGGAVHKYGIYYVKKLIELADYAERDLQLVIKGGMEYVGQLRDAFPNLVFIDSTSFMKTVYRKRLNWRPGDKLTYSSKETQKDEFLDSLLSDNIKLMAKVIENKVGQRAENQNHFLTKNTFS